MMACLVKNIIQKYLLKRCSLLPFSSSIWEKPGCKSKMISDCSKRNGTKRLVTGTGKYQTRFGAPHDTERVKRDRSKQSKNRLNKNCIQAESGLEMVQKRIYIGGLYESVKDVDLRQRFSSYGNISGIDIKVKKDSEGTPVKTFAYLDIDATDSDLQKCFRAYNKTRWKGSEINLQFAKDSFIKRLAEERQGKGETKTDQSPSSSVNGLITDRPRDKTIAMKGAKPGTLVPGQKDWVVAKYGRVEPIVNVRSNDRKKVSFLLRLFYSACQGMKLLKIDPSKYTHNVKKLKDDRTENIGSVSPEKLTWQLEESDSEIAKKRKGDFPSWRSNKRKLDSDSPFLHTDSDKQKSTLDSLFPNYDKDLEIVPISDTVIGSSKKSSSIDFGKVNATSLKRKSVSKGAMSSPSKVVKSSKKSKTTLPETKTKTSDDGYDTGDTDDTDEIIAVTKKNRREWDSKKPVVQNEPKLPVNALQERLVALAQTVSVPGHSSNNKVASLSKEHSKSSPIDNDKELKDRKMHNSKAKSSKIEDPPLMPFRGTKFLDDDDSNFEKSNNSVIAANNTKSTFGAGSDTDDSDFESLIKKTMNDRAKKTFSNSVINQSKDESDVNSDDNSDGSVDTDDVLSSSKFLSKSKSFKAIASKPKFTKSSKTLDEFSSGLMAENERENSVHDSGDLNEISDEESDFETLVKKELSKHEAKNKTKRKPGMVKESSDEADLNKELSDKKLSPKEYKDRSQTVKGSNTEKSAMNSDSGSPVKAVESKDSNKDFKIGSKLLALSKTSVPKKTSEKDTNNLDPDKKRQETVRQRQKDYEAQKNVIQKALANLDAGARPNKKIVFADSDEDASSSDNEETSITGLEKQTEAEDKQVVIKKSSGGLFDDSSEESEDEDKDRFKLRPEFEGSAGKKLMKLQSRYGNDERFKLDAKFAESDSEQEDTVVNEEDEKTRQLRILASVLGTSAGIVTDKQDKKKKTFKDVSQLQFDPSKDDHSQFEIKMAPKPKPDKIEKKKKKKKSAVEEGEEQPAQPVLPEVTKDRYSEVSESIKQAFIKKDNSDTMSQGFSLLAAFGRKDQDSEEESDEETTDKPFTSVLDPLTLESRFKVTESDSEEEGMQEEAMSQDEEASEQPKSIFDEPTPTYVQPSTFFFTEDDPRLKEGEKFHRTEDLETIREKWLKQRPALVESYRNKHKKFKRMMKSKHSKNFHNKQSKPFHGRKQKPR